MSASSPRGTLTPQEKPTKNNKWDTAHLLSATYIGTLNGDSYEVAVPQIKTQKPNVIRIEMYV